MDFGVACQCSSDGSQACFEERAKGSSGFLTPFFAALGEVVFFGCSSRDSPVHGNCQNQDKPREAIWLFDLTLSDPKAPGCELREL